MAKHREIWVLPYNYSCGGYYLAERMPEGIEFVNSVKNEVYNDDKSFWLLSGRQVLNKVQVETCLGHCYDRGEELTVVWTESLPEGARWLNLR